MLGLVGSKVFMLYQDQTTLRLVGIIESRPAGHHACAQQKVGSQD